MCQPAGLVDSRLVISCRQMRARTLSVVIPVFNGERYLAEALASVLAQSRPPDEVVVVDNGCTDASAEIAGGFGAPVRVVARPHGPAPKARNTGVQAAAGEVLAFLDADDLCLPSRFALQLAALEAGAELVFGHVEEFLSPELDPAEHLELPPTRGVMPGRVVITLVVEREVFERVGPFDPDLLSTDFLDWLARARALGLSEEMLPDVVARRRIHLGNSQRAWASRPAELPSVLRAAIRRRGGA
jgi:glycosyltransferase involved in cell wall biosynthesis